MKINLFLMKKYLLFYIILNIVFSPSAIAQDNTKTMDAFKKAFSFHYANKDSAYYYYEKTISLADKNDDLNNLLDAYIYLINVNTIHYDLKNYQKNLQRQENVLFNDKRLDTFLVLNEYKNLFLFDKGNYYYKIKQYTTSKGYFKTLLEKLNNEKQNKANIETLQSVYSFLGSIYNNTGKYDLANSYYEKSIHLTEINKDSLANWEFRTHSFKKLQAKNFIAKKEFEKANKLLTEAFIFYSKHKKNSQFKNNFISTYTALVKNNIVQGDFKKSLQILTDNDRFFKENNPFDKEIDILYGDTYLGLKKYKKALFYYKNSLAKTKAYRNNKKHQDVATIYAKLGKLHLDKGDIKKGLKYDQLALTQLEETFESTLLKENPNPKNVFSKTALIAILKQKITALFTAYKKNNDIQFLNDAHQTSKVIVQTLDALRPEFESKIDKQFLITQTYPSLQKAVQVSYELFKKTNDNKYIKDAFFFMEKSKSILLLEAQRNSEATKYGGIPESILSKEQQFRAKISHLEQTIFKSKTTKKALVDTLFSVKNNYRSYILKIEKEYPKYYAFKYKTDISTLKQAQDKITDNQAILNYLATNDTLYLIVTDKKSSAFYKLLFDEKTKNLIKELHQKSAKLDIQDQSIYKESFAVYNAIIARALKNTKATDLIISADDLINYIPFDALNTTDNGINFLLETHSISYASSVTLFIEQQKTSTKKKSKLLIFAPKFNGSSRLNHERNELGSLLYNEEEAKNIAQYFNGKIYKNDNASIANFNAEKEHYNLLHFATHASANDVFADYSYLAFSDASSDNLLYVKDIYNYQINADLVTLSACETGVGKLQKGEGMLSLARAFNYAGVPAIVTTLWKINDQSTSEIMGYFYNNLYNGLSKKEALRQAKLSYLELNDDPVLKHPYYWAGIVLTGNTNPVASKSILIWLLLGVFILILITSVIRKRKANV